jgi:hypothetical protein
MDWFTVDKEGLAALLERKGRSKAVLELIQNAWDAPGTTRVDVTLIPHETARGRAELEVVDNSPDGFADLTHAFTLFAPSQKVHDETKRGRFNLGEKLVLAICDDAVVQSTRGAYRFDSKGRTTLRNKTTEGSRFSARIRLTKAEVAEVEALFFQLLAPVGVATTFNGQILQHRSPVRSFEITLPTERADEDGILRRTRRKTVVDLYEPVGDEVPSVYELGIPVVDYDGKFHADVQQKVPLTFERDNVTPAYLRELYVAIVNNGYDLLDRQDATEAWVKTAIGDERADHSAVRDITVKRFGEKTVAYDPSDPQANAEATLKGYTVIHGGMLSGGEWANVKAAGLILPAGQVTPSNSTLETSPDGVPPIDRDQWTPGITRVADYATALAKELLGVDIHVSVYRVPTAFWAAYGGQSLKFNLQRLGHAWFNTPDQVKVDALLIHEFAHHRVSDHLSEAFHNECCRLGAKLRYFHQTLLDF